MVWGKKKGKKKARRRQIRSFFELWAGEREKKKVNGVNQALLHQGRKKKGEGEGGLGPSAFITGFRRGGKEGVPPNGDKRGGGKGKGGLSIIFLK